MESRPWRLSMHRLASMLNLIVLLGRQLENATRIQFICQPSASFRVVFARRHGARHGYWLLGVTRDLGLVALMGANAIDTQHPVLPQRAPVRGKSVRICAPLIHGVQNSLTGERTEHGVAHARQTQGAS